MDNQENNQQKVNNIVQNNPKAIFILVILLFIFAFAIAINKVMTAYESRQPVWFENIDEQLKFSQPEYKAIVDYAVSSIFEEKKPSGQIFASLKNDHSPRIVFLSISDSNASSRVFMGADKGIIPAIDSAISKYRLKSNKKFQPKWLVIDLVNKVDKTMSHKTSVPLHADSSLFGIASSEEVNVALLPGELLGQALVNNKNLLQPDRIAKYLQKRYDYLPEKNRFERIKAFLKYINSKHNLYSFNTVSFFSNGKTINSLYRNHALFQSVDKDYLKLAAVKAGDYLIRAVQPDGKFEYIYEPSTNTVIDKYNILRHAGTIYAMLELYNISKDEKLLNAAKKALDYLVQFTVQCKGSEVDALCVLHDTKIKLGGNALACIAIAQYINVTQDEQYKPLLLKLGNRLLNVQDKDGQFLNHKQTYSTGETSDFVSQYYPGEAILALLRIYELDHNPKWLDAAEKGAQYLIKNKNQKTIDNHDHWLLYALNELYRHKQKPIFIEHAFKISDAIIATQVIQPKFQDLKGSYLSPRSTPTATRSEGLCATYHLAKDFGHKNQANKILPAIKLGIIFELQTQFRPESVMYFDDPQKAIGGFHMSLTNYEIRNDYVQHNLSAMLGLLKILESQQKKD